MTNQDKMLLNILAEAVSVEIYGQEYYAIFSELLEDENAASIFRGLARDEGEHRELIEKEYRKIAGRPIDIKILDEEYREKARKIFPESLTPISVSETKDVLTLGIRTEKRSIELYSTGAQKTDNKPVKDLFLKLTGYEEGHKKLLEEALYYLEQEGSWYGYSPPTIEG